MPAMPDCLLPTDRALLLQLHDQAQIASAQIALLVKFLENRMQQEVGLINLLVALGAANDEEIAVRMAGESLTDGVFGGVVDN